MAEGFPSWIPQEQIPEWAAQRAQQWQPPQPPPAATMPTMDGGLAMQGPMAPSNTVTARQTPTMDLEPFKPGSAVPTVADLYPDMGMALSYMRSRGIDTTRWHPSRVPLQGPELKLWADREKARLEEWKTKKDVETLQLRQASDLAQARAREAVELNRSRGSLKQGYQWDPADPTRQIPTPGGPAWREQSSKHATDLQTLQGVEAQAKDAQDRIRSILRNKEGFESNFGGYNAYVTQYLPGDATAKARTEIESMKASLKSAGLNLARVGGSVGQITEREWPILEKMIDNITPALGEKDAREALNRIAIKMQRMAENAKEVYQKEWGDSPFAARGVPGVRERQQGGPYNDPEKERRYQEWKRTRGG